MIKRGGVCICYRNSLPLKILGPQYLQECINFEIITGDKLLDLLLEIILDFESFANNFELNIDTVTAPLQTLF